MFRSRRFLLVEDNDAHAKLVMLQFRDKSDHLLIDRVGDGEQALAYLRREGPYAGQERPDVVLLDLKLPRLNGHEVLRQLKADEELRGIPVIVLTTSEEERDVLQSYKLHANCFITKPVDIDQFIQVIKRIEGFWLTVVKLPSGER